MSNASFISDTKNKILSDLQNDDYFLQVLGVTEQEKEEGLVYKRLFPMTYIYDNTQSSVKSYICVEVEVTSCSSDGLYIYPTITFYVISHQDDNILNMSGISKTRLDYLAELIEEKYDGSSGFGFGRLLRTRNTAYNISSVYRSREIVFKAINMKDMCK